jgi:galactonate dehydratase
MKITGVRVFPVEVPFPHHGGTRWLFVGLETDNGIVGYGEIMLLSSPFRLPVMVELVNELVTRFFVNQNPYNIELLWDSVYARAGYSHYPEQTKLAILSGLEMACWDIVGKDVGQPVYNLLGGMMRDRVRTYTYVYLDPADEDGVNTKEAMWLDPAATAKRSRAYVDMGFTAVKIDPFGTWLKPDQNLGQIIPVEYSLKALDVAEAVIGATREAVGNECDILIGTHGQMTPAGAIRYAKRVERFDPLWFEEPVPPENMAAMAKVARATSIPITTGERLTTKYDFARLIEHEAAAIFNLDIGQVGGILEAKKIAAMAEAHYLQISPHVYNGPIIAAASVQIGICCANFLIMEAIEKFQGFHSELVDPPIEWRDGYVVPSGRPGLGHDLIEEVALAHAPK